ncbi:hypothetical protein ACSA002_1250 [Salmonella phage vB_SalM_SA002]|nr:hypothetical protein ACSA002_1250 [Salmonella phage vB_SalM_SA002]
MSKFNITVLAVTAIATTAIVACELKIKKLHKEREAGMNALLEEMRFNDAKDITADATVVA